MAERDAMIDSTRPGHYGAPGVGVTVAEATIAAAWNVQGDASRASFVDEVRSVFGIALPIAPNTLTTADSLTALWLGPRSWLLIAGASPLVGFTAKRDALNAGGALFDVSASRVAWTVSGPRATDEIEQFKSDQAVSRTNDSRGRPRHQARRRAQLRSNRAMASVASSIFSVACAPPCAAASLTQ